MTWTLEDLIKALEAYPADHHSPVTLAPCSHRWDHSQLAFVVSEEATTVGELLTAVRAADGASFEGYKGGHFTMRLRTEVFAVECHSHCGSSMSAVLLRAWLGPVPVVLPEGCEVVDGQRRWREAGGFIFFHDNGAQQIQLGSLGVVLPAETLAWLRTGEVSP